MADASIVTLPELPDPLPELPAPVRELCEVAGCEGDDHVKLGNLIDAFGPGLLDPTPGGDAWPPLWKAQLAAAVNGNPLCARLCADRGADPTRRFYLGDGKFGSVMDEINKMMALIFQWGSAFRDDIAERIYNTVLALAGHAAMMEAAGLQQSPADGAAAAHTDASLARDSVLSLAALK